jgi:hypothetical protein
VIGSMEDCALSISELLNIAAIASPGPRGVQYEGVWNSSQDVELESLEASTLAEPSGFSVSV